MWGTSPPSFKEAFAGILLLSWLQSTEFEVDSFSVSTIEGGEPVSKYTPSRLSCPSLSSPGRLFGLEGETKHTPLLLERGLNCLVLEGGRGFGVWGWGCSFLWLLLMWRFVRGGLLPGKWTPPLLLT